MTWKAPNEEHHPFEEKPFPNNHACRLREPGDFQSDSFKQMERDNRYSCANSWAFYSLLQRGDKTVKSYAYSGINYRIYYNCWLFDLCIWFFYNQGSFAVTARVLSFLYD